ncbi:MAG TPA: multicopper oxidase domain-containing protein [Gemmatimonadaceae bacterium]|nr:multicopper oxidase domain-containing protein [Gemmatimonadaceae bacterium]
MYDPTPRRLSEIAGDPESAAGQPPSTRRDFLAKSSLSLVVGGSMLLGCRVESDRPRVNAREQADTGPMPPDQPQSFNANSKLDTAIHRPGDHAATTTVSGGAGADGITLQPYDAALPPLPRERTTRLNWRAQEVPVRITSDTVVAAWTFEGNIPGPIVHCRVGDTVEFTLTNEGAIPHSMDFHAAQIDPKVAFRSVVKDDSVSFTFRPRWAGAFMYHCGTAPVLLHIGAGMYGAIIVSPREPLPPAREYVLVQSEFYLGQPQNGIRPFDYNRMLGTVPEFLAFNGRPNQYIERPLRARVGERVRFYVVNCGPTHASAFHVVGEQFDSVYPGAPPGSAIRGVQTLWVPAGGGMVCEVLCDIPGEFPFVNHGFGHGQKGAVGFLVVE